MNNKNTQKELGQFFTPAPVASLVTKHAKGEFGDVVDLAAGAGDLLWPAQEIYRDIAISAVDVDPSSVDILRKNFPNGHVLKSNALKLSSTNQKKLLSEGFDLVVGNPPYNKQQASKATLKIIKDELGVDLSNYSAIRAEVGFIALSLRAARCRGYISLVLPKTIAVGESWQWLREVLLRRHAIVSVATLPASVFQNTEVETCVLTLRKGVSSKAKIKILNCDREGRQLNKLSISPSEAIYRLDYDYHAWLKEYGQSKQETLHQIGVEVVRGNIHSKKARDMGIDIFHTSNFNGLNQGMVYFPDNDASFHDGLVSVEKNDILLPRVGRNLHQLAKVASGKSVISDCIFGVKVPDSRLDDVHRCLETDRARDWIKVHTSGACAKIISKSSLLNMPLLR